MVNAEVSSLVLTATPRDSGVLDRPVVRRRSSGVLPALSVWLGGFAGS